MKFALQLEGVKHHLYEFVEGVLIRLHFYLLGEVTER